MSEQAPIQRWSIAEIGTLNGVKYKMHPFNNGGYVLYADHVAALADERLRLADMVKGLLFRKDGSLHSVGSSVDDGPGIEFCCACDGNYDAALRLVALIRKGDSDE